MVDGCSMPRVSRLWPHVIFLTAAGIGGVLPKCRPQVLPVGVGTKSLRGEIGGCCQYFDGKKENG